MKLMFRNISLLLFILFFIASCGFGPQSSMNHSTNTQVVLSKANYKVINSVSGTATARYVLGIGPSESKLIAKAKQKMTRKANLPAGGNKSRALINITEDRVVRFLWFYLPFYTSITIHVSADVIEFIPEN